MLSHSMRDIVVNNETCSRISNQQNVAFHSDCSQVSQFMWDVPIYIDFEVSPAEPLRGTLNVPNFIFRLLYLYMYHPQGC